MTMSSNHTESPKAVEQLLRGMKNDQRPPRGFWAPGLYMCQCTVCQVIFGGDKRATCCADCAYKYSLEEVVKRAAKLRGEMPVLVQPSAQDHDIVALLSEMERLAEEAKASRELIGKLEASLADSASAELRSTLGREVHNWHQRFGH